MAGTRKGGLKAKKTNKRVYGKNFYKIIGRKGGLSSRDGGFASNKTLASTAGAKGGRISRRGPTYSQEIRDSIQRRYHCGWSVKELSSKYCVNQSTIYSWMRKYEWGPNERV